MPPVQQNQNSIPSIGCSFSLGSSLIMFLCLAHRLPITVCRRMPTLFLWMLFKATTSLKGWSFLSKIKIQLVWSQSYTCIASIQQFPANSCTFKLYTCFTVLPPVCRLLQMSSWTCLENLSLGKSFFPTTW